MIDVTLVELQKSIEKNGSILLNTISFDFLNMSYMRLA